MQGKGSSSLAGSFPETAPAIPPSTPVYCLPSLSSTGRRSPGCPGTHLCVAGWWACTCSDLCLLCSLHRRPHTGAECRVWCEVSSPPTPRGAEPIGGNGEERGNQDGLLLPMPPHTGWLYPRTGTLCLFCTPQVMALACFPTGRGSEDI